MEAITPDTVKRINMGEVNAVIATFSAGTADDGDTWDSGIHGILDYWAVGTDDPTQTKEGIDVSESSGTFTFSLGEDNRSFILTVICRS